MKILFVEDGSVNVDNLEERLKGVAEVVVYRQGSEKPFMMEAQNEEEWKNNFKDYIYHKITRQAKRIKTTTAFTDILEITEHDLYRVIYEEV